MDGGGENDVVANPAFVVKGQSPQAGGASSEYAGAADQNQPTYAEIDDAKQHDASTNVTSLTASGRARLDFDGYVVDESINRDRNAPIEYATPLALATPSLVELDLDGYVVEQSNGEMVTDANIAIAPMNGNGVDGTTVHSAGHEYINVEGALSGHATGTTQSSAGYEYVHANTDGANSALPTNAGAAHVGSAPPPPVRSRPAATMQSSPYYVDPTEGELTLASADSNGVYYTEPTPLSVNIVAESAVYSVPMAINDGAKELAQRSDAPVPPEVENRLRRNSFC